MARKHLVTAVPEDADEAEGREQVDQRKEVRPQVRGGDRALVHGLGVTAQGLDLAALGAEPLHDANRGDRLLDDVRDLGERLLLLQAHRVHAAGEPGRGDVEDRKRGEREERKAGAAIDEDAEHRDHRHDARDRQRHEQDHVVDLLDVAVGTRHELPGLRLVVKREVQALEVRDESHADVGLDADREAERGVPANGGARGLDRADDEDGDHPTQQRAVVVVLHDRAVDRDTDHRRYRHSSGRPSQAGEHTGDDRGSVRLHGAPHEAPPRAPELLVRVQTPAPSCPSGSGALQRHPGLPMTETDITSRV